MDLQYLTDESGNHTAVVVPIKEWEDLTRQIDELKKSAYITGKVKPSDFAGTLPGDVADAMHEYIIEARQNWS